MNIEEKVNLICKTLSDRKAEDILKIDVKEKSSLADYFVIASGKSQTQVRALSDYVTEAVEKNGGEVRRSEGIKEGRWAVVDFGDVIVHIFNDDTRLFYNLERLWVDGNNAQKID